MLGEGAFNSCSRLKTVKFSEGLEVLGSGPLSITDKMSKKPSGKRGEHVDLPSTLRQINDDTFSCCVNLKHIVLPNSLEFIGRDVPPGLAGERRDPDHTERDLVQRVRTTQVHTED